MSNALLTAAVRSYQDRLAVAVARCVAEAAASVPAFAERLARAGLDPADRLGPDQLAELAVLSKDDLIGRQRDDPPFGGLVAPTAGVVRVFQSPGPLYEPGLAGADPWRWAQALRAAGFGAGDRVLNCFGYHLSPAGAMFELGCLEIGATVVPAGIGNTDLQAGVVADLEVTGYVGLPSYLAALVDRYQELGLPAHRWRLDRALVTAEPLPDSLRARLTEHVPTVLMAYGTAEAGAIGYEVRAGDGLVPADGLLVQVCDLDTGRPLVEGEGQVVVTLLRPEYPLVRFGTGDLSAWRLAEDDTLRLAGVLGRVGQAVKVRGMFLHPRQAQAVLAGAPGVAAWQLVVERVDHRDRLRALVVPEPAAPAAQVVAEVEQRIRSGLRFGCVVDVVDALPDDQVVADRRDWS